ncbi:Puratrophin-1 [Liparis tanakae]|uniref:Puratrophin-1 n=1 Tax=Liparis tanakae TaxID=230148 RepID=A0A4Z2E4P9_9TELE|nr:Puratrophin-1 [Liparis tanakae]
MVCGPRGLQVNLKEQGQLIRQDEFTVWSGRRKCQRQLFLFEELVLFSKPRRTEGGPDVFMYKHSFKVRGRAPHRAPPQSPPQSPPTEFPP